MNRLFTLLSWCISLLISVSACTAADEEAQGYEFFEKKVRPLLVDRCFDCHSADNPESELQLDTLAGMIKGGERGAAIVPGDPKKSLLIIAVNHGEVLQMPPKEKLSARQIADLAAWVKMGAPWPNAEPIAVHESNDDGPLFTEDQKKFWAFQTPILSKQPTVKDPSWIKSPIDRFLLSQLEAANLKPAVPAEKRTLLRRATFDLTGLPPTVEEIDSFLNDDRPDAFAHAVDRLLASPRYGERWGRHWLDVVRYADSNGLDENLAYANAFRYRDYVIKAFNNDKPFDRFVQEQIAGDLIPALENEPTVDYHDRLTATAFLSLGPKMLAEDDPMKMEMDIIDEQVDTVSRAFMGLTMGCARCHDHKFDPLPMSDYYSLAGIFKSTKTMENHRVVAVWHEYTIATEEAQAKFKAHEQSIKDKDAQLKRRIAAAQQTFLEEHRAKAGRYLQAAAQFIQFGGSAVADGTASVGEFIGKKSLSTGTILREAEKFDRGTLQVDTTKWGKDVGVLLQGGFAEYDIEIPTAGRYQFELRYAAEQSRPVLLSLNGRVVKKDAAVEVTGGWYAAEQRWHLEGVFEFKAGKNILKLERNSAVPHIDKILLIRLPETSQLKDLKPRLALNSDSQPEGTIVVEAEKYTRGTFSKRPPVIQNGGNGEFLNEAEYEITVPAAGNYQLDFLYACGGGRKFRLSIDGQLVNEHAANKATGGFGNDQVKWFAEGVFNLSKGKTTVRIEVVGPTPHLDKFALIPTKLSPTVVLLKRNRGGKSEQQLAKENSLNQQILKQWIRYLQTVKKGNKSIWQPIAKAQGMIPEATVDEYQQRFDKASAAWKQLRASKEGAKENKLPDDALELYRVVLYATSGPYRLPQKPEKYYSQASREEINKIETEKKNLEKNKPELPKTMGVREGEITNLKIHLRGSHITLGREVPRQFFQIIEGENQSPIEKTESGRLQLANWLTKPDHPLTSRVMVNRIWQWHFGTGLVRTPDNFGRLGQRPTNQPLLDWLAVQFVKNKWSIKEMHRLIMLSNAYRMSTTYNENANAADPDNRLYWRFNRRRMEAEEVRDSILAMGGNFDFSIGGQLMKDKNRAYVTGTGSKVTQYHVNRRSVYLPILRSAVYQVLQAFDFADPSVLTGQRQSTTVAPQALFMMNSELVAKNAGLMANDLLDDLKLDDNGRLQIAFERAYGRKPSNEEVTQFLNFVQKIEDEYEQTGMTSDEVRLKAWRSLCRVLIASNEFVYIE